MTTRFCENCNKVIVRDDQRFCNECKKQGIWIAGIGIVVTCMMVALM